MSQQNGSQRGPMFAYPSLALLQVARFRTKSRRPIFSAKRLPHDGQLGVLGKPVFKDFVKCFCLWHPFLPPAVRTAMPYIDPLRQRLPRLLRTKGMLLGGASCRK